MHRPDPHELWLEPMLDRHLAPVTAPDRLWDLVQHPPTPRRKLFTPAPLLVPAFVILLAAATWSLLPRFSHRESSNEVLAIQALASQPEDLELRADTITEIRAWVKSRTGLDIPLPGTTVDAVQMTGVCAVKGGTPAVEVAYRVGGRHAALLVSKAGFPQQDDGKHRFLKCESVGAARVSSWTMRGQLYTLAYAATGDDALGAGKDECLLCHTVAQQLTLSN